MSIKEVNQNPTLTATYSASVLGAILRDYGYAINQLIRAAVTISLQAAFNAGKVISNANSKANALRVGGATDDEQWAIYHDSIAGHIIEPVNPANIRTRIQVNKTYGITDIETDTDLLEVDPDIAGAGGGLVETVKICSGDPTGNPPSGYMYRYFKSDGLYQKTSAGVVTKVGP